MKTFAVLVICIGLILSLGLVDANPSLGLAVYAALAALCVGLAALDGRPAR